MAFSLNCGGGFSLVPCEGGGGGGGGLEDPHGINPFPIKAADLLQQRNDALAWEKKMGSLQDMRPVGSAVAKAASAAGSSSASTPALDLSGVPVVVAEWAKKLGIPTWLLWAFLSLIAFELIFRRRRR